MKKLQSRRLNGEDIGMYAEAKLSRYTLEHKTFIIKDLDMERAAQKKVGRRIKNMNPKQREVFTRVTQALGSVVIWKRFNKYVSDAVTTTNPRRMHGNIYDMLRDINTIINRTEKWVRNKKTFTESEINEYTINILRGAKSICRVFDRNATCWEREAEKKVIQHV